MKKILAAVFACALIAQLGVAAEGSLLKVMVGSCNFKVMDASGVKPIAKATVTIADTVKGATIAKAVTDATGRCKIDVAAGHYILKVNDQLMAVMKADTTHTITECQMVMRKPVVVGDGDDVVTGNSILGISKKSALITGSLSAAAAAGGYEWERHNDDGDNSP
jgi:hypothetical protein